MNAWGKISSAASLLQDGKFNDASYLVGYAAEMALKARYCTRKGWSDFPDDRAEARRRGAGGIMIHDLEELLRLSDHTSLQQCSMLHIDWPRVMDWSEQDRYRPPGTVTREHAEKQIEETRKLFGELVLFEVVEKLLVVEREVSQASGPFNLFAFVERLTQTEGWQVLMSAWWLSSDTNSYVEDIAHRVRAILDEDLYAVIRGFTALHPRADWVQRFHALGTMGGFVEHHPRYVASHNFIIDRIPPPAFIITNAPRPGP